MADFRLPPASEVEGRTQPEDLAAMYRDQGFDEPQGRFLAGEEAATARLMGFYKQARAEIMTFLFGRGNPTPNDTTYYEQLTAETDRIVGDLQAGAREWIEGTIPPAFVEGARTQNASVGFTVAHDKALQALASDTLSLITNTNEGIRRSVQQTVAAGILEGLTPAELATRMAAGGLQPGPWKTVEERAGVIARTETMKAYNAGNIVGVQSTGAPFTEWIASPDEKTCEICGPRDGVRYRTPGFDPSRLGVKPEEAPVKPKLGPDVQELGRTAGVAPFTADAIVTLAATEQDIVKNADHETLVLVNPETGAKLGEVKGGQYEVNITPELEALMPNAILTHNHPFGHSFPPGSPQWAGTSFSEADAMSYLDSKLMAIRAIGPGWMHTISTPDGTKLPTPHTNLLKPGKEYNIFDEPTPTPYMLHNNINLDVRDEFSRKVALGEMTTAQAGADHQHEVTRRWVAAMNEYGVPLTYTREMVPESWDTSPRPVPVRPAGPFDAPYLREAAPRTFDDTEEGWKAANKWGTETWADTLEAMSGHELNVISQYSASGYKVVNNTLRGVPIPEFMAKAASQATGWIASLDQAVARHPVPEDVIVSRSTLKLPFGVTADQIDSLVGRSFTDAGYYSTSVGPARGGLPGYPVRYKIKVPAGTPAAYIASVSASPQENELLLDRGLEFRITAVRKTGDRTDIGDHEIVEIEMEAVPGSSVNARRSIGEDIPKFPAPTLGLNVPPREYTDRDEGDRYGRTTWGDAEPIGDSNMYRNTTGIYADMSYDERYALTNYSQSSYSLVNGYLRKTGTPGFLRRDAELVAADNIPHLDRAVSRLPVPEPLYVTRTTKELPFGVDREKAEQLVGRTYTDPGFFSTSLGPPTSGWASYPVHYRIMVPAGTAAAYIAPVSGTPDEHELLLDRGLEFRIVGTRPKLVDTPDEVLHVTEVDLEVVPKSGVNYRDKVAEEIVTYGPKAVSGPKLTPEAVTAITPRRYTNELRDQTLDTLRDTPEGKLLADSLSKFQKTGSIARLRSALSNWINGRSQDPTSDARAAGILGAIASFPEADVPDELHRGIVTKRKMEDLLDHYRPGRKFDLNLTSFTSDRSIARTFAGLTSQSSGLDEGQRSIVVRLVGRKRALPIQNLGDGHFFYKEREWTTAGGFVVESVKPTRTGLEVTVRQESLP